MSDAFRSMLTRWGFDESLVPFTYSVAAFAVVLLLAVVANFVARRVLLGAVQSVIRRTRTSWDDAFLERGLFRRIAHLAPALVIHLTSDTAFGDYPRVASAVKSLAVVYVIVVGLAVIDAFLNAALDVYEHFEISRRVHLKGFVQVVKVALFILGAIGALSFLIGQSPVILFSGLGALSAVLLLVFKDPILNLVAGIQLMANHMVERGDWIELPKHGIDGDVIDVSLTTIKVQNWDKTISTIPPYALVNESFRNWRGMQESGGRRIKRAILIDMNSVAFCTEDMLDRFRRFHFIQEYIERKVREISEHNRLHDVDTAYLVNGRHLTNLGTFRAYLAAYLRNHPKIHPDLTFLVRHRDPTPKGLPIEVYVFSNDQRWAEYEAIQADIFDHILAVIPLFELRVFQEPTGADLRRLAPAGA